jgi:molybdopterin molybdotransferase/putative molybdopterin biosynthesis protein
MLGNTPLLNIPGPPLAAYFVLDWCAAALVARYYGTEPAARKTVRAALTQTLDATPGMEILRKLELQKSGGGYTAAPVSSRGASTITTLTAPAQLVTDGGGAALSAGDTVEAEFLR